MRDLTVTLWRFDESDEHYRFQIERLHCGRSCRQLALAAIDEHNLGKRFLFGKQTLISTENRFVHGCKVVRALDSLDNESSILRTSRFAILEDDDTRHVFGTGDVRDVE